MNRGSFFICGSIALNAVLLMSISAASAARLPTSTLTVSVLSVDRESVNRQESQYSGQPAIIFETTKFVAKAQVINVVESDRGLSAGAVIDIRYRVTVRQPPHASFRVKPSLNAGEIKTITVFGSGSLYNWRN